MNQDQSPWGPAVIALVFALLAVLALVRVADMPGVWLVVVPAVLVAAWFGWKAVTRLTGPDDPGE